MAAETLEVGDVGPYAVQAAKSNPNKLVLVYIPALSALLARATELKGKPLSEAEIQKIASQAEVVAAPKEVADAVIQQRGGTR
ncbi:hypothetical protein [uncultured Xylophilus sp.]|uniref:hypothetical protein n=1 Tax=uncultured Xylophilus sp. TaxID=296832 RepID=UPI0025D72DF0|nr:hypothetical protein [uncultured Xylophilus sp.]